MTHPLRDVETTHWAVGVLNKTWIPALSLFVLVAGAGWIMQTWAPEAQSLGDFLRATST